MEPTDPNFLVQKPKKERTPAQKLATQNAFSKLKEKREAMKAEKEEVEEVVEVRKVVKKPITKPTNAEPVKVVEQKPKPVVEQPVMNEEFVNSIVNRLKSELTPAKPEPVAEPAKKERKKKVVVVEESESESSSSEEEVVIRRKKVKAVPKQEPVKPAVKEPEPIRTGSRVLDKLFFNR